MTEALKRAQAVVDTVVTNQLIFSTIKKFSKKPVCVRGGRGL